MPILARSRVFIDESLGEALETSRPVLVSSRTSPARSTGRASTQQLTHRERASVGLKSRRATVARFYLSGSPLAPGVEPPRNSLRPSARTKFLPTALFVPSLA